MYLCGSDGNFEKNESLAVTFAEKAAARQLPAAEFGRDSPPVHAKTYPA
jgi:hypothetical protein